MPAQLEDDDNDNYLQYLGTQATNIVDKNSKNNQTHHYSSSQGKSKSNLDKLEDIDKLLSNLILPRLVLLSRNLTFSQLSLSTSSAMTQTACDITQKKTYQQERLKSQILKNK